MTQVITSFHDIRFSDCDPYKHLNNSKYLEYFLSARKKHVKEAYDYDIYQQSQITGETWVTASHRITYIHPVQVMERVCIQSRIVDWGRFDNTVEFIMWNEEKTEVKAFLWTRYVYYSLTKKRPIPQHDKILEIFHITDTPISFAATYEERLKQIR